MQKLDSIRVRSPRQWLCDWLGVGPNRLYFNEDGSITFSYPHPNAVEPRKRLIKLAKSNWAVGLGCTLFGVILGKLF